MNYEQISKIIESCHLNFLIGAGASRPFLGILGPIERLLTDLAEVNLKNDKKNVIDVSIKKYYYDVAIKDNLLLWDKGSTQLDSTTKSYQEFIQSVNTILTKRKSNLISKQANLFTTNMDLFLDKTLEENQYTFNDGFSGRLKPIFGTENFHNTIIKTSTHYEYKSDVPLFNLFKLHGSLNWKLENDKIITYDNGLSILKELETIELSDEQFLRIEKKYKKDGKVYVKIYSITDLINQYDEKDITFDEKHSNFLRVYDKLVMINPTKDKFETTTINLTFYELLRMYSNHLEKENSVLFVIGFSFADEHIKEITKRVISTNPTLQIIVFAHDQAAKTFIENELPKRNNVTIMSPENEEEKYSLDAINKKYFLKLANQLTNSE